MSLADGAPAYGGTPSDESVKRLIKDLKERDLDVVLYPFVMMDVPAGNSLPDPYGGTGQPPYPWRGRITCDPAPGRAGSPDGTSCGGNAGRTLVHAGCGLQPHGPALCGSCGGGGRRPGLHPRQRARRPHARALRIGRLSGGRAAAGLGGGGACDPARVARRSSMPPTGRNTARMFSTAAARCAFPSIRFSPTTTSMRSGSIIIRRSPTGATRPTMPIWRRRAASTTSITCAGGWAAARRSTGTMPMHPSAMRRRAGRSRTEPTASHGSSGRRISSPGGRTGIWSAWTASRSARPHGSRNRSRSGSPRSAFPPSTRGRTDRTSFPIRNPRNPPIRRSPAACATISCRRAGWRPSSRASTRPSAALRPSTIRPRHPITGAWWTRTTSSSGPGMRGLFPPSPISTSCGRTAPTGRPATGSRAGSKARPSTG